MTWNKFVIKPSQVLELLGLLSLPAEWAFVSTSRGKIEKLSVPNGLKQSPMFPNDITYLFC